MIDFIDMPGAKKTPPFFGGVMSQYTARNCLISYPVFLLRCAAGVSFMMAIVGSSKAVGESNSNGLGIIDIPVCSCSVGDVFYASLTFQYLFLNACIDLSHTIVHKLPGHSPTRVESAQFGTPDLPERKLVVKLDQQGQGGIVEIGVVQLPLVVIIQQLSIDVRKPPFSEREISIDRSAHKCCLTDISRTFDKDVTGLPDSFALNIRYIIIYKGYREALEIVA